MGTQNFRASQSVTQQRPVGEARADSKVSSNRVHRLAALLLASILLLSGCGSEPSVEEQIQANIAELEAAGEAADADAFMARLAEDFQAAGETMDATEFRRFLWLQRASHQRIEATLFPVVIQVTGPNLAEARFKVLLLGGNSAWLPDSGQLFDVETRWVLQGGDWLLWRADWRPASGL